MSTVGAYIDLPKWENVPLHDFSHWEKGDINTRGPEGLEVTWEENVPKGAQVYIEWTPRVFAVWEEEEIENGNGNETEPAGPNPDEEANEESGQPGDLAGEAPATGPEEPQEVE